jgi:enoyl-CoA hydratase/carnithine racemase
MSQFETILVEQRDAVTLVTLNRPQALNALNNQVLSELIEAFAAYDSDPSQRCLVLTGSEKAFAAGADIKEMQTQGFSDMFSANHFAGWGQATAKSSTRISPAFAISNTDSQRTKVGRRNRNRRSTFRLHGKSRTPTTSLRDKT